MRTTLAIGVITLALAATDVSAACKQASLQGNWHYFATNLILNEDFTVNSTILEDCTFQITRAGVVRNATCVIGDASGEIAWALQSFP
jgi:hypothetical protein